MYAPSLVFESVSRENQFRQAIVGENEVGGWLLCNGWAMPGFDGRAFRRLTGQSAWFVHGLIIAPNRSKKSKTSWMAWDWGEAQALAVETANAQHCQALPFHTHPNGVLEPSANDIAFYARNDGDLFYWFAIATPHPPRLMAYAASSHATCSDGKDDLARALSVPWRRLVWNGIVKAGK